MNFIQRIFRRKVMKAPVRTLRIDGCKTTLTPAPDDAELAAQALLESIASKPSKPSEPSEPSKPSKPSKAQYYRQLSERIKESHAADARMAMRYVAYVEQELAPSDISHQTSDISELERGLYQHQDTVEREGGELLKRWQHCLAECIVRQMTTTDDADLTDVETTATT